MPTYGRAHYVGAAVNSALKQTYKNIEVLVLDDCSPDNTAAVIEEFLIDPRMHYVRHAQNLGIANNWRYAIAAARGYYFCFLHDDDTIEPDFIRVLMAPHVADATLALTFCDHSMMDSHGTPRPHEMVAARFHRDELTAGVLAGDAFEKAVLENYSIPIGATLFRRSAVDPNFIDERAKGAIDYWLLYRILQTGLGAFYVNQRLMNYRSHPGGMSSGSALYMAEGHLFRFNAILNDLQFSAWWPQIAAQRRDTLTGYGIDLAQSGRIAEARDVLRTVLRERISLRAVVASLVTCGGSLGQGLLSWFRSPK